MSRNCKPPVNAFGHRELQKLDALSEDQLPQVAGFDGNLLRLDIEQAVLTK
jgi:hypothetical protein